MSANLVLFCLTAFVLIVTPGPNFFYVLTRGAAQGRRAGVVASMTNPKTILFFLSFLPQFVTGPPPAGTRQMLALGGIYMLLTILVYSTVACLAGSATRWLREGPARGARLRRLTATSFIGLGLWAALPDRR